MTIKVPYDSRVTVLLVFRGWFRPMVIPESTLSALGYLTHCILLGVILGVILSDLLGDNEFSFISTDKLYTLLRQYE